MRKTSSVFTISAIIAVVFVIWGALAPQQLEAVSTSVQTFLEAQFGWFYLISATVFLLFCVFLIFSRFGKIKLGKDDEEPEYNTFSWFAMLFSAGMGIGLVFWGTAEPLSHLNNPPFGDANSEQAAKLALRYSFFHWGLHPWGIYTLIALALAYFKFRKGAPGVISATFYPLLGDRVKGPLGKTIDVIAVFATVFGVATSLGLGAIQINGGLSFLYNGIPNSVGTQFLIIAGVTILFMLSAISGLGRGIKWLSNTNLTIAFILMLFVLFLGPTNFLMKIFTSTLGGYLENLPAMSFRLAPFNSTHSQWIKDWTIFYWSWWIAWSPFVGTFIARVSRGRTVREFILGVLLVPTIFSAIWFAVFGGTGINLDLLQNGHIWQTMGKGDHVEVALFAVLQQFPLSTFMSLLAILLISTFFITSADSATFVLGMQTTNGMLNPPATVKIVWGVIQSASAAVLLWSGGLQGLQTASIVAAFPFTFILILMMFSLYKAFKNEPIQKSKRKHDVA
ncbi:MAG TPA: BCCT family transporter [Bacillales bacterium]|nr:BCCT family transporter [Bacillales bacterium]